MRGTTHTHPDQPPARTHAHPHPPRQTAAAKTPDHHQLLARATNDAVRDWDLASGTINWPDGAPFGQIASASIASWRQQLHPADRERIAASLEEALASRAEKWSGEYRLAGSDGSCIHVLERAAIVRDETGAPIRFLGTLMDVTARREFQDQLARSQKMEAFGQLAGGMAHDFNNFLTAILGYSDLVVAEIAGRGAVAKYISEIRGAAGRAASLTEQLLAFSRRQPLELRVLEVNALISDLERSILRLLGEHIAVFCELLPAKRVAYIKVDPSQFTQIIVNLAVNARDAMPAGGKLVLKTETVRLGGAVRDGIPPDRTNAPRRGAATTSRDAVREGLAPDLPAGDYVVISMIDNGCGMSEEVKARLFEPFFTTKDDGRGSGLGLAACYGIVRQSGGHIALESEPGKGTAVHIYLPEVAAPGPGDYRKPRASHLPGGTETVLMLEDDISVRHVMVRTLRRLGYEVIEAVRAEEARQRMGEQPVDLVVSDIVLPDTSGRDFARWTREHHPKTPVLLTSGYFSSSNDGARSDVLFLAKPFDPEQLARAVRSALDANV